jgi:hypothetical protein
MPHLISVEVSCRLSVRSAAGKTLAAEEYADFACCNKNRAINLSNLCSSAVKLYYFENSQSESYQINLSKTEPVS